jgi:hypothetical protein
MLGLPRSFIFNVVTPLYLVHLHLLSLSLPFFLIQHSHWVYIPLGIGRVLSMHWSPQLFVLPVFAHTSSIERHETRCALWKVGLEVEYDRQP